MIKKTIIFTPCMFQIANLHITSNIFKTYKSISCFYQIMSIKRKNSSNEIISKKQKSNGHWSLGLLDSMKDPNNIVQEDELTITIKDKYPKAQFHYLIIPKETISSLKSVTSKHHKLLTHMLEVGQKLADNSKHNGTKFKIGYHAEASMFRLHLHVISEDMNSNCLKTKKHWNSFTTNFFLDVKDVNKQLQDNGKIILPPSETCKRLLDSPLKCHKCDFVPKNMPDLKRHIIQHV